MSKTANEQLYDFILMHKIYLLKQGARISNLINKLLAENNQEIQSIIMMQIVDLYDLTPLAQLKGTRTIIKQVEQRRSKLWEAVQATMMTEMLDISTYELLFFSNLVDKVLPVQVALKQPSISKQILSQLPVQGNTVPEWIAQIASQDLARINATVTSGVSSKTDVQAINKELFGTKAAKGADGVVNRTAKAANSVVTTSIDTVAHWHREQLLSDNSDIFEEELFVATLDARTTIGCMGYDGKRYKIGEGPKPPLHFNCRSLRVAYFNGVLLGDRPANPTTERQLLEEFTQQNGLKGVDKRTKLPYGTKTKYDDYRRQRIRELVGPIPASTNYQDWLKNQPSWFQEDVLGKTKAKLFRDGEIPLEAFSNRFGNEYTLAELAKREAAAFNKAGLDPVKFN